MTLRLKGQNCKIFTTPLSCNSQKRLEHKENPTKYRKMARKPRRHVRILIYRMCRTRAILILVFFPARACICCKNWYQLVHGITPPRYLNKVMTLALARQLRGGKTFRLVLHAEISVTVWRPLDKVREGIKNGGRTTKTKMQFGPFCSLYLR